LRYHGNNHVYIELDQLGREISQPFKLPFRKSILDQDILSLDVTKLAQPTLKFIVVGQWPRRGRAGRQVSNPGNLLDLLRSQRNRPCECHTAEQQYELTPF